MATRCGSTKNDGTTCQGVVQNPYTRSTKEEALQVMLYFLKNNPTLEALKKHCKDQGLPGWADLDHKIKHAFAM